MKSFEENLQNSFKEKKIYLEENIRQLTTKLECSEKHMVEKNIELMNIQETQKEELSQLQKFFTLEVNELENKLDRVS